MRNLPNIVHYRVIFIWIYRPIHRTNAFIVDGADLENTRTITFKISWWTILFWSIYIKKQQKLKSKFRKFINLNQLARLADNKFVK